MIKNFAHSWLSKAYKKLMRIKKKTTKEYRSTNNNPDDLTSTYHVTKINNFWNK